MSRIVITGVTGHGAPNRIDLRDFVKDVKFFSLYIQALQRMADTDQKDFKSHFQVGGIHGLPYIAWDGAGVFDSSDPNKKIEQWKGYCTHGSVLFPTWHRPYVMLYEQIMQKHAADIAATYTVDKDSWVTAANNIRQPYWDWASNAIPPDEVIVLKQVSIIRPDGKKVMVDNPLYHYKFHPIEPSFEAPFINWPTTLRQPTSDRPDATDNIARLKSVLSSAQTNITVSTYNMLTRVHDWNAFSNHTVGDGGSKSNSIEAIHDIIHNDVGGQGHMSDPGEAAFDPIFFLHHSNVDRMLSIWSALNHGAWVTPNDSNDGNFTIPKQTPVDKNTGLTPFWNSQTTFWPSDNVQVTAPLGYTYPEFNDLDHGNPDGVRRAIGNAVNRLYGSSIFSSFPATGLSTVPPNHGLYDWTVRIESKKYELKTGFSVQIFLGSIPENPADWHVSPHFVGAQHAFVNSRADVCSNCVSQARIVIEGFVHLNWAIVKHSGLDSLEPEVVVPYLTKELGWRVQKNNGEPAELQSLEVTVTATPLTYPPGALFPVPGTPRKYNGITHGRPGGSREA